MATCPKCYGSCSITCPSCGGTYNYNSDGSTYTCSNCGGSGKITCPTCYGTGNVADGSNSGGSSYDSGSSGGYSGGGGSSGSDRVDRIIQEGNQYYKAGDYENAISKYTQAINQGNIAHKSVAHKNRAICSRLIHQYDQAIADFNAVLNIGHLEYDVLADIYNDRGEVYQLKGDKEQAVSDWKLAADYGSKEALIGLDVMGIKYTPKAPKSSTSSSSSESGGKGSIIFGIIGAIVCGLIGATIISFLGIGFIGGAIGGFFLGKWLGGKIFGKILILALLIGGGLYFGRSYITPLIASVTGKANLQTAAVTQTATATVNANVNFRAEPSTGDNIIRQLQQGDTVTLTGETSGNWTQIVHGSDTGWISSEFLNKQGGN
jgi:hypothetical protein